MIRSLLIVLVVTLMVAALSPAAFAGWKTVEIDGQTKQVQVDQTYWDQHPETRGLQAAIAKDRGEIRDLREDVGHKNTAGAYTGGLGKDVKYGWLRYVIMTLLSFLVILIIGFLQDRRTTGSIRRVERLLKKLDPNEDPPTAPESAEETGVIPVPWARYSG